MNRKIVAIFAFSLFLFASCGDYTAVLKNADYEYKYEAAKQYYTCGQYNKAIMILQDVLAVMKGTEKGEESLYLLSMSAYKAKDYVSAASFFRKYYQSYPRGLYNEEARFHCGKSLYMCTPEPKLDQTDTYEAVTELQNFLEFYPDSHLKEEAHRLIFALQDKLIDKEYLSAKLYFDLGGYFMNCSFGGSNFEACIVTAENAMRDYPYMTRREDFSILILKAKYQLAVQSIESKKEERFHNAIDEYYGFTNEFPESKYGKEAKEIYEKAKKNVKNKNQTENGL